MPRAMELEFSQPANEGECQIKTLIDQHAAAEATR